MKLIYLLIAICFSLNAQAEVFQIFPPSIRSDSDANSVSASDVRVRIKVSPNGTSAFRYLTAQEEALFSVSYSGSDANAPTFTKPAGFYFKGTIEGSYPGYKFSGTFKGSPVSIDFAPAVVAGAINTIAAVTPQNFQQTVGTSTVIQVKYLDFYGNIINTTSNPVTMTEASGLGSMGTVFYGTGSKIFTAPYTMPSNPGPVLINVVSSTNTAITLQIAGYAVCGAGKHEEGGSCVSNTRPFTIQNGTATQTWDGGWGTPLVQSCSSGYHIENSTCVSDSRSCSITNGAGSETWNGTTYGSCLAQSCSASFHIEINACISDSRSCSISNGSGSQTWSGTAYGSCLAQSCSSGYLLQSSSCNLITYTPSYSAYAPVIPSSLVACDGTIFSSRSMTCTRDYDSVVVPNSNCPIDSLALVSTQSPSGNKIVAISNGSETFSCPLGSSSQSFVSRLCDSRYTDDGSSCQPIPVNAAATKITAGFYHTCVILADSVKCTGNNDYGQFGDGTTISRVTPVPRFTGAKSITAGALHTCAIMADNSVQCSGYNSNGQLGDGTTIDKLTPVIIPEFNGAKSIVAGTIYTCAIMADDSVKCTGRNDYGQLGDGTGVDKLTPVTIAGFNGAKSIYVESFNTCAIMADDSVKCTGANFKGVLGNGMTGQIVRSPITLPNYQGAKSLVLGEEHSCAIMADDSVKCSGYNSYGQLGDGTIINKSIPVIIPEFNGAKSLASGKYHTCAIMADNSVKCTGLNAFGGLGDGTTIDKLTPVTIPGYAGAKSMDGGLFHTCAIMADNSVKCSGYNSNGQLGNGTFNDKLIPTLMLLN